jgi:hypothetical protein
MDARAQLCMGLRQASAADGLDRAGLDVDFSAQQLVLPVDGVGQFGSRIVDSRSHFAPLHKRRQEAGGADAPHAATDLPVSCPAVQCELGSSRHLAACHLLLPAVFETRRLGWAAAAGATAALAMLGKYYSCF